MTRGLVSPDRSRLTGLISQSASWSCVFTVSADSEAYYELLQKARTFLRGGSAEQNATT